MRNKSPMVLVAFSAALWAQTGDMATVVSRPVSRTIDLPAEFLPFLSVTVHARVPGYVERVLVDRGSVVKKGQILVELSAPEMKARIAEAESRVEQAEADRIQAEAQLAAAQSTAARLKRAAETPGAIAGNELVLAEKQVDAAQAAVHSREHAKQAAQGEVRSQLEFVAYLHIAAPFDGVVTDRFVHPGALVSASGEPDLLAIQQVSHLRLVVPVPEEDIGATATGVKVEFKVPAYPDRTYSGTVARSAHALDRKTRTMPVELDVYNRDGSLSPGMYPTVKWPVRRTRPALFVPKTSVVTTTERTFAIRNAGGRAEWVDVKKGSADGDLIEVSGNLQAGDQVVRRGTDEVREGTEIRRVGK
jgi:membrane fusion protein (multidrug efflux system)